MSTHYKHGDHVPTEVLAKRLDELSDVIGQPGEERDRELTRRIPAELDRDADLVLSEAAQRLLKMEAERDELSAQLKTSRRDYEVMNKLLEGAEAERDALAAHVERLRQELRRCASFLHCHFPSTDKDAAHKDAVALLKDKPETSLTRLKAQWKAEALEAFGNGWDWERQPNHKDVRQYAEKLRRQAEGGDAQ